MPDCMRELDARGLRAAVLEAARSKPFLGICIGLQMLFERSEEGDVPGLGLLPGQVVRFPCRAMVGRRRRAAQGAAHGLEPGAADARASAVGGHRRRQPLLLRPQLLSGARRSASSSPGTACIRSPLPARWRENLFAVQFHPEKSQDCGPAAARQLPRLGRRDSCPAQRRAAEMGP